MKSNSDQNQALGTDTAEYDRNTLPSLPAIRKMMKKIHAPTLRVVADKLSEVETNDGNAVLTHATDSTTRTGVGSFSGCVYFDMWFTYVRSVMT